MAKEKVTMKPVSEKHIEKNNNFNQSKIPFPLSLLGPIALSIPRFAKTKAKYIKLSTNANGQQRTLYISYFIEDRRILYA